MMVPQETERTFEVDGHTYTAEKLTTSEGTLCWVKLMRILGKSLQGLDPKAVGDQALVSIFAGIVGELDPETFELFVSTMRAKCRVRIGKENPLLSNDGIYDIHFMGRYAALTMWLAKCLMFNYGNFFSGTSIGSIVADLQREGSRSQSPQASTGSSGES